MSMERSGKMQITHENKIEKAATVKSYRQNKIYTEIRANFVKLHSDFELNLNKLHETRTCRSRSWILFSRVTLENPVNFARKPHPPGPSPSF